MFVRKLIAVWMVVGLFLGFAGMNLSAQEINDSGTTGVTQIASSDQEIKGTVSRIEGTELTLVNNFGEHITVSVEDPELLKELKVGDRVVVKDGRVTKENT